MPKINKTALTSYCYAVKDPLQLTLPDCDEVVTLQIVIEIEIVNYSNRTVLLKISNWFQTLDFVSNIG